MHIANVNGTFLHYRIDGPDDGVPVVFANSLGTDMRLWDPILPLLPAGLRILRYDKRGHGLSDVLPAPYTMGQLVSDVEALMVMHGFKDALFVGLSIGGLIAQGIAAKRHDLVRAMVLSNTGAKIGTRQMWDDRIAAVRETGTAGIADAIMQRWFHKDFLAKPELSIWRNMVIQQSDAGYMGCSAAIAGTDFYSSTSALRLPTLGIAGSDDGATPADLVKEMTDLVPGSKFHLIRRAGHLPCVEHPQEYADVLTGFMKETGHV